VGARRAQVATDVEEKDPPLAAAAAAHTNPDKHWSLDSQLPCPNAHFSSLQNAACPSATHRRWLAPSFTQRSPGRHCALLWQPPCPTSHATHQSSWPGARHLCDCGAQCKSRPSSHCSSVTQLPTSCGHRNPSSERHCAIHCILSELVVGSQRSIHRLQESST
jgi:hypothetical protein